LPWSIILNVVSMLHGIVVIIDVDCVTMDGL